MVGNADLLGVNSENLAHTAQLSCMEELEKTGSAEWDM